MKDRFKHYITHHHCLIEDLRIAAKICEQQDRTILANNLRRYADNFQEIDNEDGIADVWDNNGF